MIMVKTDDKITDAEFPRLELKALPEKILFNNLDLSSNILLKFLVC